MHAAKTNDAPVYTFARATREKINLLIGLAGGTGSGKTYSAMRLAQGMAGGKPFAVIDTEANRAKHYADTFAFDHCDLRSPFRPASYMEAILAADEARYPVIMVDSCSHEWAGEGGMLDMQDEELDRMAGDDWKKREACKMSAWIRPKAEHKRMMQRLLQIRSHLILCFRAEEKIEMERIDGRMQIVPKKSRIGLNGWIPICEKSMPFELTASFLLTSDAPGIPKPIKLEEQHKALFPLTEVIGENSGKRIAEWAAGGGTAKPAAPELDKLIEDYGTCGGRISFEELETRRRTAWGTQMPAGYKARIKDAADAARARIEAEATAAGAAAQ